MCERRESTEGEGWERERSLKSAINPKGLSVTIHEPPQ